MRLKLLWLLFALAVLVLAWALRSGLIVVPDAWKPWTPLRIDDVPNLLTRYKLARLARDDAQCRQTLAGATMRYAELPDRDTGPGCGFRNAVRIERTSAAVGEPFSLSCRAAVSLALWERHVLQPEALARFGERVARIEHFGSYACRNVYGRESGRRSRHATADAFDIAGLVLAGGRRIRVLSGWRADGGDDEAAFLRSLHRGACRWFDTVLGPDYNAAHRDHFHFERGGGFRFCR